MKVFIPYNNKVLNLFHLIFVSNQIGFISEEHINFLCFILMSMEVLLGGAVCGTKLKLLDLHNHSTRLGNIYVVDHLENV